MLNRDTFTRDQLEILNLKLAIKKFKEYDRNRKEYYSKALTRLGELESLLQEITDQSDNDKLKTIIINQRRQLHAWQEKSYAMKILDKYTEEEIHNLCEYNRLKNQNEKLKSEVKSLKKLNSDLITELIKYKESERK